MHRLQAAHLVEHPVRVGEERRILRIEVRQSSHGTLRFPHIALTDGASKSHVGDHEQSVEHN